MTVPLERWRLVLGGGEADGTEAELDPQRQAVDDTLAALYDAPAGGGPRRGGLAGSSPRVSRWLGEARRLFSSETVRILQRDALDRLGLKEMLLEPELLESVAPDLELASTLLSLREVVPERSREAVRAVVQQVARELRARLEPPLASAIRGEALRRVPVRRPRFGEVEFAATVRENLHRYEPSLKTIVPAHLRGRRRARASLNEVFLLVDQSASMAASLVHACVCASVLATLPALETHLVVFDSAVVDLTEYLDDPVDVLFGVELGGGTDIEQAIRYAQSKLRTPEKSVLVLVSDLFEGGDPNGVLRRAQELIEQGVTLVVLLALDDEGTPVHDEDLASALVGLEVQVLACAPKLFPDVMARVLRGEPLPSPGSIPP